MKLYVFNVLSKELYDDCHIIGSKHFDSQELDQELDKLDKNNEYIVYCAHYLCSASHSVAKAMVEQGFKNVWEYAGGIVEWYQKGYPVQGPCKQEFLNKEIDLDQHKKHEDVPVITAEDLLKKIQSFEK